MHCPRNFTFLTARKKKKTALSPYTPEALTIVMTVTDYGTSFCISCICVCATCALRPNKPVLISDTFRRQTSPPWNYYFRRRVKIFRQEFFTCSRQHKTPTYIHAHGRKFSVAGPFSAPRSGSPSYACAVPRIVPKHNTPNFHSPEEKQRPVRVSNFPAVSQTLR